jgi:HAE1 family hydrophobic/amphiphilic exporter-1
VRHLAVHSPLEIDVPLAEVAYMSTGYGPSQIQRLGQQRVIVVSANIYKRTLKEIMQEVNMLLDNMKPQLSGDYSAKLTGENLEMKESFASLQFALILSLVLVYMIMAAEFESLWQPFVILFTFPLSIIGVALGLWLTHTPISIMVILGVIILGGIVVDNSIVLIEYVNQLRAEGNISLYDALVEASRTRLRPIMMTALTTILGLLPLAIGLAEGAEIQIPMAVTVMAGLTISTFLSLVIIPALYLSFENLIAFSKGVIQFKKPPARTILAAQPVMHLPQKPLPGPPMPAINLPHKPLPVPEGDLTERQKKLLSYLLAHKKITRLEYSQNFDISIITAARDLKALLNKGLVKAVGPKAAGRYYELA